MVVVVEDEDEEEEEEEVEEEELADRVLFGVVVVGGIFVELDVLVVANVSVDWGAVLATAVLVTVVSSVLVVGTRSTVTVFVVPAFVVVLVAPVVSAPAEAAAVSASCFFKIAIALARNASWVPPLTKLVCSVGSDAKL